MQGKILIIDDDPIIVTILEEQLSRAGYTTESVTNGQEALDIIHDVEPALIISDIMMPRMDGYELHRHLRQNPHTASIPFVFLTAKSEPSDQLEGLRMGADDYVCKPFEIHDLIDRMEKVLARAAKAKAYNLKADFSGNAAQMNLTDILQIVELNHKTGRLLFKNLGGKKSRNFFLEMADLSMHEHPNSKPRRPSTI